MRAILLVFFCARVAAADTYPRQPGVDAQHYIFRVTLSDQSDEISGETNAVLKFLKDGITEASLDLASVSNGKGMTVEAVTSDAGAVRYQHESDRLRLTFPPAKAGEIRQFTVKYHGTPGGGLKTVTDKFGDRVFFSVNWPDMAHQWLPTIDHPYDKATSEFLVTAPSKYQVVANGLLVEQIDLGDGRRTTHWKQSVPIATWLNNIGVAQFSSRNFGHAAGVPLQSWVFYQDRENGIATFEEPLRRAIQFYNDAIGPYPYEKLAAVEAAGMGGGMEHASEIFFGERAVTGRPASGLVAHETAHQWFGDSVTESDWDDVWLSEGFATYFALLTAEHYEGREAFVAGLNRSRTAVFNAESRLPGVAVVQSKPWKGIPNQIVYQKGGWALHVLRGEVGNEKFWAGIREYYRRFRDSNASTADFRKVMEEVSGQDLGWFFQQWLYRAGSPSLEGKWKYDSASHRIAIDLSQTEPGEPFRLPLEIAFTTTAGAPPKTAAFQMTEKRQHFEIACDREPATVELDPHTWLLAQIRFTQQ
jgi:aminopeptidase N